MWRAWAEPTAVSPQPILDSGQAACPAAHLAANEGSMMRTPIIWSSQPSYYPCPPVWSARTSSAGSPRAQRVTGPWAAGASPTGRPPARPRAPACRPIRGPPGLFPPDERLQSQETLLPRDAWPSRQGKRPLFPDQTRGRPRTTRGSAAVSGQRGCRRSETRSLATRPKLADSHPRCGSPIR